MVWTSKYEIKAGLEFLEPTFSFYTSGQLGKGKWQIPGDCDRAQGSRKVATQSRHLLWGHAHPLPSLLTLPEPNAPRISNSYKSCPPLCPTLPLAKGEVWCLQAARFLVTPVYLGQSHNNLAEHADKKTWIPLVTPLSGHTQTSPFLLPVLKIRHQLFYQQKWVYLWIAEELQFRTCKLWQTIIQVLVFLGEQRKGTLQRKRGSLEGLL